ncbi:MAG: hypothetical protein COB53_13495 [Elusimicrobia bacterium]|nr:MAG: hypothetical protein COB53_13495 [Elusimicrobiota bacterium]
MALIREFLEAIDKKWKPVGTEPITLEIIGSAALMLQCDYERGTKDADVLENKDGPPEIKEQLLSLAEKETDIYKQFRIYIDVVTRAILFLPQRPLFHPLPDLTLKNFNIEVLDINDVVLSKLKRYNNDDKNDIRAMAQQERLDHKRLVARFEAAVEWFSMDARSQDMARYLRNLNTVERDILDCPPSKIELPD